jgi:fatty-acid desaturase
MMRILILLHWSLMINSLGNFIGRKPYNKNIRGRDSDILNIIGLGEGKSLS